MYTCYKVVLVGEDGEYPQSEWQTLDAANIAADKIEETIGDGQHVVVESHYRGF